MYRILDLSDNFFGSFLSPKLSPLHFIALHILTLSAYNKTNGDRKVINMYEGQYWSSNCTPITLSSPILLVDAQLGSTL